MIHAVDSTSTVPRNLTVLEDGFVAGSLSDCRAARTRQSRIEDLATYHRV